MVLVTLVIVTVSIAAYPFLPRLYAGAADIVVRASTVEGVTSWEQTVQAQIDDNAIQTKIDILKSPYLQQVVAAEHKLLDDPEFNTALRQSWLKRLTAQFPWLTLWFPGVRDPESIVLTNLVSKLSVSREGKSYFIRVGYRSQDPSKAASLTNSLIQHFIGEQLLRKRREHEEMLNALNERATSLEARYYTDEHGEHEFAEATGLLHAGERQSATEQLRALSVSLAEAHRRSVETSGRAAMLAANRGTAIDGTTESLTSPLLQRLRERYVEAASGAGSGSTLPMGLNNTQTTRLRQGIEAEAQRLVLAAQNDAMVAAKAEADLRAEVTRLDVKLTRWEEDERIRKDKHRAVDLDLKLLDDAHQRFSQESARGDTLISGIDSVSMSRVADRPAFPNPLLYIAGTVSLIVAMNGLLLLPRLRTRHAD